ncbi:MAG TPA: hypothetical protein VHW92_12020 [Mycobacteriales bacterium]|nr:hypothetical protein [Mycobacteriales bacterium]
MTAIPAPVGTGLLRWCSRVIDRWEKRMWLALLPWLLFAVGIGVLLAALMVNRRRRRRDPSRPPTRQAPRRFS